MHFSQVIRAWRKQTSDTSRYTSQNVRYRVEALLLLLAYSCRKDRNMPTFLKRALDKNLLNKFIVVLIPSVTRLNG